MSSRPASQSSRAERLAAALRANLVRRRAQKAARAEGPKEAGAGRAAPGPAPTPEPPPEHG